MKITLSALSVGVAMFTGAGLASAEETKLVTPINIEMETTELVQSRASTPVALTDQQMDKATAGHLIGPGLHSLHYGWYWHQFLFLSIPQLDWHIDK